MGFIRNCGFCEIPEAEIRSRIIKGCFSDQLRVEALAENLDAAKLISMGRAIECAKSQSNTITEVQAVAAIRDYKKNQIIMIKTTNLEI
jgi:hypothetical protein